jgi:hypothetical protein
VDCTQLEFVGSEEGKIFMVSLYTVKVKRTFSAACRLKSELQRRMVLAVTCSALLNLRLPRRAGLPLVLLALKFPKM